MFMINESQSCRIIIAYSFLLEALMAKTPSSKGKKSPASTQSKIAKSNSAAAAMPPPITPNPAVTAKLNAAHEPLSAEELRKMNAYWRAANYLSVGQIYL